MKLGMMQRYNSQTVHIAEQQEIAKPCMRIGVSQGVGGVEYHSVS